MASGRIIIVGLGLMGGSLAMGLRPHYDRLCAVDTDERTRQLALERGVVDAAFIDLESAELQPDDLIILAVPVRSIIAILKSLPTIAPKGCMVFDLGSTKSQICREMSELPGWFQAIGGHPMCGKEIHGFESGSADLYAGNTFIITPTVRTTPDLKERVIKIIETVGGLLMQLPPERHDQLVAVISHVPFMLSATLMHQASQKAKTNKNLWQISASGFRSTSRLASSDPKMMHDIMLTNRDAIVREINQYRNHLSTLQALLESADSETLMIWLRVVQREHQRYRKEKAEIAEKFQNKLNQNQTKEP